MSVRYYQLAGLVCTLVLSLLATTADGQDEQPTRKGDQEFYEGYYHQHATGDYEAAAESYRQALKFGTQNSLAQRAKANLSDLKEELAISDFASLMPVESIAYLEISNPADHVESIAKSMGLIGKTFDPARRVTLPIDNGFEIASDFQLSPSLIREMKKIRGAAISIESVNLQGNGAPANGLAVIHPGDSDLLGGLIDTGVQLIPMTEKIGGFPTYTIENEVWMVTTRRLILVSDSKDRIEAGLAKLVDAASSLAEDAKFKNARAKHSGAAVFAFARPSAIVEEMKQQVGSFDEMRMADVALDFDHLEYLAASISATDGGLRSQFGMQYAEDHSSLAFALIRTQPMTGETAQLVPRGVVAVGSMGLNPQLMLAAQATGIRQLSALDIGREFFSNIKEASVFVLPTVSPGRQVPDCGVVISCSDVKRSEKLWNELLSIPAKMEIEGGPQAETITIGNFKARQYTFGQQEIPQFLIAKVDDNAMVAGTRAAVEAVIQAQKTGQSLTNGPRGKQYLDAINSETAKAVFVDVSQALQLANQFGGQGDQEPLMQLSQMLDRLCVSMVVNETNTALSIQTDVTGLPQFESIIQTMSRIRMNFVSFGSYRGSKVIRSDSAVTIDSPSDIRKVDAKSKNPLRNGSKATASEPAVAK
ncbi:MAG: hypothetical protein AAFN77_17545 [Planctomycetota bacterium]